MTQSTPDNFLNRVLDIVFGKRAPSAERDFVAAAQPPKIIKTTFRALQIPLLCVILVLALWSYGWLPFVESRISRTWFWSLFGINVLLTFVWEQITKHYERRAKAERAERS